MNFIDIPEYSVFYINGKRFYKIPSKNGFSLYIDTKGKILVFQNIYQVELNPPKFGDFPQNQHFIRLDGTNHVYMKFSDTKHKSEYNAFNITEQIFVHIEEDELIEETE